MERSSSRRLVTGAVRFGALSRRLGKQNAIRRHAPSLQPLQHVARLSRRGARDPPPESSSLIAAGVASILFSAAACEMDFRLVVVAEGVDSEFETPVGFDPFCFFLAVVVVAAAAALGGFSAAAAATDARLDLRSAAVDALGVPSGKIIDPDVVAPGVTDCCSDSRRLLLLLAAVGGGGGARLGGRRARGWYPR